MNATYPLGPKTTAGTPLNTMIIDDVDVVDFPNIKDVTDPNGKKFYSFKCSLTRENETSIRGLGRDTYTSVLKGTIAAPFNLVSGTLTSGYNYKVVNNFKSGTILTNLHSDTYMNKEIALQGPFADAHVGGHQSRHIAVNRYNASYATPNNVDGMETRPEAWRLWMGPEYGTDNTMMGFVGADYPYMIGTYPNLPL